ncbi:hypothetical protein B0T24DRAFT_82047 [Lasiosphaeria ovina]|uniref:Uncharacterized protein n=1 Tax=Lasiosphaeria ovina TaxID=92902 RepID=A0AAE0TYR3_9PEZI|nr:hypothetical protein B0T24DRAFT_82047 [Lasiosphaeria ovina]
MPSMYYPPHVVLTVINVRLAEQMAAHQVADMRPTDQSKLSRPSLVPATVTHCLPCPPCPVLSRSTSTSTGASGQAANIIAGSSLAWSREGDPRIIKNIADRPTDGTAGREPVPQPASQPASPSQQELCHFHTRPVVELDHRRATSQRSPVRLVPTLTQIQSSPVRPVHSFDLTWAVRAATLSRPAQGSLSTFWDPLGVIR